MNWKQAYFANLIWTLLHTSKLIIAIISTDYKNIHENINLNESVYIVNRPSEIAQSTSLDIDWILHLIDYIADDLPDLIILLRPTSPFRTADFVNSAISNLINNPGFDSSRSVHLVKEHPDKMWRKHEDSIVPYNSFNLDEKLILPHSKSFSYSSSIGYHILSFEEVDKSSSAKGRTTLIGSASSSFCSTFFAPFLSSTITSGSGSMGSSS